MLDFLSRLFRPSRSDETLASPDLSPRVFHSPRIPPSQGFESHMVHSHFVVSNVPKSLRKRLRFSEVRNEQTQSKPSTPLWKRLSFGSDDGARDSSSDPIGSTLGVEANEASHINQNLKQRALAVYEEETRENQRYDNALKQALHRGVMDIPMDSLKAFEKRTRESLGGAIIPSEPSGHRKKRRIGNLEISIPEPETMPDLTARERRLIDRRDKASAPFRILTEKSEILNLRPTPATG
jgi:hypothetical protein